MRHLPRSLAAAAVAVLLVPTHAQGRPSVEDNLAEMYDAAAFDPADVSTRLRLAGYLQSLGLVEEGNALLRELAAAGADVDLLIGAEGAGGADGCVDCPRSLGADLIVGDINSMRNWGKVEATPGEWVWSFSNGRTACNIGDVTLEWIATTNHHSVFGGTIFRIHNNQLRQIGQGWLKHSFFALSQNLCSGGGCQGTNGSYLGVDCSDPYTASRTGSQNNLGPRWQVRVSSGYFPYPPQSMPAVVDLASRRINVRQSDLNPADWPGAIYFTDAMYVQWQDAQDDNDDNNNSWRPITIPYSDGGTPEDPSDDVVGLPTFVINGQSQPTRRMQTPIDAWRSFVPAVESVDAIVPSDGNLTIDGVEGDEYWSGRFQVGALVEDNGDGSWTYHYAIFNQNSDRAARSFTIPVPSTVVVTDAGFGDVDYHSGDGEGGVTQDGADWTFERDEHGVAWSTQTIDENPNANALRWAATYTFWFTADAPPSVVNATLGLFRPGADPDPVVALQGPACLLAWDLDGDDSVGFPDLNMLLDAYGAIYDFADLNSLLDAYGDSCD